MSMISAQCDRLRDAANALQEIIDDFNKANRGFTYSGIVSTLHYAINGLRSAADTIWELRNNLSDMVDCRERARELEKENENLRGKLQALRAHGIEVVDAVAGGVEIYSEEHAELDRLKAKNAKLRESVRNLLTCVKHEECEESCPNYEPMYTDYGYEKNGSTVVESEYLGCCTAGLENCNSMLFDADEYLRGLGIGVSK